MHDPTQPTDMLGKAGETRAPARGAAFWTRRPRLIISTLVMIGSYVLMPRWVPVETHLVIAFDAGAIVYLAAI
jgi:hypothetical protein